MKKLFLCLSLFASSAMFAEDAPETQNEQDDVAYVGEPGRDLDRARPGINPGPNNPGGPRRGVNPRGPRPLAQNETAE